MNAYELLVRTAEILVTHEDFDGYEEVLAEDCYYHSDYAERILQGRDNIIANMKKIAGNLDESSQYSYEIVEPEDVLKQDAVVPGEYYSEHFAKLYQYDEESLTSVIMVAVNEDDLISRIVLSRDKDLFDLDFYDDEPELINSPLDIPMTILLNDPDDIYNSEIISSIPEKHLRRYLSAIEAGDDFEKDIYVWVKADDYVRKFLNNENYYIKDRVITDDYVEYHCIRYGSEYHIFMFAYSPKGENDPFSESVLTDLFEKGGKDSYVVGINVRKSRKGKEYDFKVKSDGSNRYGNVALWKVQRVGNSVMRCYINSPGLAGAMQRFIWAFNNESPEAIDELFIADNPVVDMPGGTFMNAAVATSMIHAHQKHGDMKIAYRRTYRNASCDVMPYLEGFGAYSVTARGDKIVECELCDAKIKDSEDLICIEDPEPYCGYYDIPKLISVEDWSDDSHRFCKVLNYDNGERKLFALDVNQINVASAVICGQEQFTDEIWSNGKIESEACAGPFGNVEVGESLIFENGYVIPFIRLYKESFSFPDKDTKTIRLTWRDQLFDANDNCADNVMVGRINNMQDMYFIDRNKMAAKRIPDEYQETPMYVYRFCGGYSDGLIMVSTMDNPNLEYHHNFSCCAGMWGWLDTDMNVVIEPQFVYAENFMGGIANVCKGEWSVRHRNGEEVWWCDNEQWGVIDTSGNEIVPCRYDEIYDVDNTDRYRLAHKGGWDEGNYCIYDIAEKEEILQLDFDFDAGYMFNEVFVTEDDRLCFFDHQPGEELDYVYVYDLEHSEWVAYKQEYTERTLNGESQVTVTRDDGMVITVF